MLKWTKNRTAQPCEMNHWERYARGKKNYELQQLNISLMKPPAAFKILFQHFKKKILLYKFSKYPLYIFIRNQFAGSTDIHQK